MNADKAIETALKKYREINKLLDPVSEKLAEILEDECAHVSINASDVAVIAYRGGMDNAGIFDIESVESLLKLNKTELLKRLDDSAI